MCVAILAPAGKRVKRKTLQQCWSKNPDGAGLLFAHKGKLRVYKELKNFEAFYLYYKHAFTAAGKTSDFAIHFRIRTQGLIDEENCHPHLVNKNLGFIHQGTISSIPLDKGGQESDTIAFNKKFLKKLPPLFLENEAIVQLISNFCVGNKLVFMNSEGKSTIINKHLGQEENGVWFSNMLFKPSTIKYKKKKFSRRRHAGRLPDCTYYSLAPEFHDWETGEKIDCRQHDYYCLICGINKLRYPGELEGGVCVSCAEMYNWLKEEDYEEAQYANHPTQK